MGGREEEEGGGREGGGRGRDGRRKGEREGGAGNGLSDSNGWIRKLSGQGHHQKMHNNCTTTSSMRVVVHPLVMSQRIT